MSAADEFLTGGMYAFQHGKYDEAIKMFSQGLRHSPSDAIMLNNRAICYRELKEFDKALIDANAAIAADPTDALFYSTKATILTKLHRQLEAIQELDTAIALEPIEEYIVNKVVILRKLGNFQEALTGIEQVELKGLGSDALSWYKAKILVEVRRFDEAEIALRSIKDPNLTKACAQLLDEIRRSRG